MSNKLERVGWNLLPAIAYGDAAGLPVETKSSHEIASLYGVIDQLIPPTGNPYYRGEFEAGTTSDDTQLSVAVAESLIEADGFDLAAQAQKHLEIYLATPREINYKGVLATRGWGGSTTSSMERLFAGVPPIHSGMEDGAGNGIIMKMAPLVYWQSARGISREQRHAEYDALTTMTHNSEIARGCTRLHGDILGWLVDHPGASIDDFRRASIDFVAMEPSADPKSRIDRALRFPTKSFTQLVGRYAYGQKNGHYGFFVPNTLAMAYDVFTVAGGDYETAVYLAVNLGGDTDSVASIVGSMCDAWSAGEFDRPQDFDRVQDHAKLSQLSRLLAKKALQL